METFITTTGSLALVKAIVDFIKYIRARDTNGWLTQLVVWLAGIAVVLLLRSSDFAGTFMVGTIPLSEANTGTLILAGFGLGATAMFANEIKKAIDGSDDASKPALVPDA